MRGIPDPTTVELSRRSQYDYETVHRWLRDLSAVGVKAETAERIIVQAVNNGFDPAVWVSLIGKK